MSTTTDKHMPEVQRHLLTRGLSGWFKPYGIQWQSVYSLARRGLMEHSPEWNYRTTDAGRKLLEGTVSVA